MRQKENPIINPFEKVKKKIEESKKGKVQIKEKKKENLLNNRTTG